MTIAFYQKKEKAAKWYTLRPYIVYTFVSKLENQYMMDNILDAVPQRDMIDIQGIYRNTTGRLYSFDCPICIQQPSEPYGFLCSMELMV